MADDAAASLEAISGTQPGGGETPAPHAPAMYQRRHPHAAFQRWSRQRGLEGTTGKNERVLQCTSLTMFQVAFPTLDQKASSHGMTQYSQSLN